MTISITDSKKESISLEELTSILSSKVIAVLLPCYNEEATIGNVVKQFRQALPMAKIYVYDNNSDDNTAGAAKKSGAIVRTEIYQGKGNVVRRMFADINADIYILADGDETYDASFAGQLVHHLILNNFDMVVGSRMGESGSYRRGHQFGNIFFNKMVARLFGSKFTDILSGYRVFSKRFAKSFPIASSGFEIETELSIHALDLKFATSELNLPYGVRPEGSQSKLRTYRDGWRILVTIIKLYKELKPLQFFSLIAMILCIISICFGLPIMNTYLQTGLVPRLPTAILAMGIMQLAFLSLVCGIIVEAISKARHEAKRMHYLHQESIGHHLE